MNTEVIILAAGKGTRMCSDRPKVLHSLAGKPLLQHLLETVIKLRVRRIHVVVGYRADLVEQAFSGFEANWVRQEQQKGTGHAVAQVLPHLQEDGQVLILNADVPMISLATIQQMVQQQKSPMTLLTVSPPNAHGYGRVVRAAADQAVRGIVEEKDATEEQRRLREVYTGIMSIDAAHLKKYIAALSDDNEQGEFYLTDIVASAVRSGVNINTVDAGDYRSVAGLNNKAELALMERHFQKQQAVALMQSGVTLFDPDRLDIRGNLRCGVDCSIDINCLIEGEVVLGDNVQIGANCILINSRIGNNVQVAANTIIEDTLVGAGSHLGPFTRTRPGTVLGENVRLGNFVEIKKSKIGKGSKINHLSYVGDSEIGCGVNIGAGVITCNYDGANKYRTTIGDNAFIGSNVALVAPIKIGDGATVGAGSTLGKNAPANKLTIERAKQITLAGWKRPVKKES